MHIPRSWRSALVPLAVGLLLCVWAALAPPAHSAEPLSNQVFLPLVPVRFTGPSPTPLADPRFGIIATGDVTSTLQALGVSWWYDYGQHAPGGPGNGVAQIAVNPTGTCCARVAAATLQAGALAHPGGYWIIGNEPNVPGQDNISPAQYATELSYYASTIKGADPTAQIVGPNALNWDTTCVSGCNPNPFTPGENWVGQLFSAWATQFGGEPSIDVWAMHAYAIDWYNTPMTNANDLASLERDILGFSTYLAGVPAQASKPVWVTELGILWAYPGWNPVSSGCAAAPNCIAPIGAYDSASVASFLDQILTWLTTNSAAYRLQKWFLYINYGQAESYATTYAGISLLTDSTSSATLTQFGQIYRQHAVSGP
jgi:hypothetical protein